MSQFRKKALESEKGRDLELETPLLCQADDLTLAIAGNDPVIAWVTTNNIEFEAAKLMFTEEPKVVWSDDRFLMAHGRVGNHDVVLSRKQNNHYAISDQMSNLIEAFPTLKVFFLVGTGRGLQDSSEPQETERTSNIRDVVIGTGFYQYQVPPRCYKGITDVRTIGVTPLKPNSGSSTGSQDKNSGSENIAPHIKQIEVEGSALRNQVLEYDIPPSYNSPGTMFDANMIDEYVQDAWIRSQWKRSAKQEYPQTLEEKPRKRILRAGAIASGRDVRASSPQELGELGSAKDIACFDTDAYEFVRSLVNAKSSNGDYFFVVIRGVSKSQDAYDWNRDPHAAIAATAHAKCLLEKIPGSTSSIDEYSARTFCRVLHKSKNIAKVGFSSGSKLVSLFMAFIGLVFVRIFGGA